jgi:chaperone required for assembly of F1-ATPase
MKCAKSDGSYFKNSFYFIRDIFREFWLKMPPLSFYSIRAFNCNIARRFSTSSSMASIRNRFYKTVTVVVDEQSTPQRSYGICLDQRRLKTPAGHRFSVCYHFITNYVRIEVDGKKDSYYILASIVHISVSN